MECKCKGAGVKPRKAKKGNAVLWASAWLDILDLIIRANLSAVWDFLNAIIKVRVIVIIINY